MGDGAVENLPRRRLLHAGCGKHPLYPWMVAEGWDEVRLDIDPETKPDIVASITDLGDIGMFDQIVANHVVEHLYPAEVQKALTEFYRVLNPGGLAMVCVPDLEDAKPTYDILYDCEAGQVCGHDLFYGYHKYLHNPYMAHHSGFVAETIVDNLKRAGFDHAEARRMRDYQLVGLGVKKR